MNTPTFLMCPPDFFEIAYEINPWMSVRRQMDHALAQKQWAEYRRVLCDELGAKVEIMPPLKEFPDMVFTANAGSVKKRIFVRSNFRHKERKGEAAHFENWFKKKGFIVKTIDQPYSFEGEGDALLMNGELYTGFHFRSDVEAHDQLSGILDMPYFALQLCDKRFYHLDTCFAPLEDQIALAFLPAFETYAQLVLLETIPELIQVPEEEALRFACNAVVVGKKVILPLGCPKTTEALEKRGYHVYALDFSEFIKAGGAAKCLVLKLA